jgi:hypothetical protein
MSDEVRAKSTARDPGARRDLVASIQQATQMVGDLRQRLLQIREVAGPRASALADECDRALSDILEQIDRPPRES